MSINNVCFGGEIKMSIKIKIYLLSRAMLSIQFYVGLLTRLPNY